MDNFNILMGIPREGGKPTVLKVGLRTTLWQAALAMVAEGSDEYMRVLSISSRSRPTRRRRLPTVAEAKAIAAKQAKAKAEREANEAEAEKNLTPEQKERREHEAEVEAKQKEAAEKALEERRKATQLVGDPEGASSAEETPPEAKGTPSERPAPKKRGKTK